MSSIIDASGLPLLAPADLNPPLNPTLVTDGRGLEKVASFIARNPGTAMGYDVETNVVDDFYYRRTRTKQIGNKDEQYVIDLLAFTDGNTQKLIDEQGHYGTRLGSGLKAVVHTMQPALCSSDILKVGVNLPFEYETNYWGLGERIWHLWSCDIVEKALWAGTMSLKNLPFFSMEQMVARKFKQQVSKALQTSFDLETPLTEEQIVYAAFDTRVPLALRLMQLREVREAKLDAIALIENDALGSFSDIFLNGLRNNTEKWEAKIVVPAEIKKIEDVKRLDAYFIPIVGNKSSLSPEEMQAAEAEWNALRLPGKQEEAVKEQIRNTKDKGAKEALRLILAGLAETRAKLRDESRAAFIAARQRYNAGLKIVNECQGEALINYDSNPQLLKALWTVKGFNKKNLPDTNDDTLKKLSSKPAIAAIREYRDTQKTLSTYGRAWLTKWSKKPGNDLEKGEGWIHPETGRIHSRINQLEAETGRTSSVKPNVQNLPHADEFREPFECDPPNENIRISVCCDSDTTEKFNSGMGGHVCSACGSLCETKAEEYCIVTVDMSGAELRIIADYANAKTWIDAFNKGWDVHSVSTEILYPDEWTAEAILEEVTLDNGKKIPPCAYFTKDRQKCKCPLHSERRNDTKAVNFLLCYGGGPDALAEGINKSREVASNLLLKHRDEFPDVHAYLDNAGKMAVVNLEARDMFGRRRKFEKPTYARAGERFFAEHGRNPDQRELAREMRGLYGSIERRGKNMGIQGTNASIIKRAMGCGFDKDRKPYLWHTLPQYKAKLINMVHDELVAQCPKRYGDKVLHLIGDAYVRASAEVMKKVKMDYEGHVDYRWRK